MKKLICIETPEPESITVDFEVNGVEVSSLTISEILSTFKWETQNIGSESQGTVTFPFELENTPVRPGTLMVFSYKDQPAYLRGGVVRTYDDGNGVIKPAYNWLKDKGTIDYTNGKGSITFENSPDPGTNFVRLCYAPLNPAPTRQITMTDGKFTDTFPRDAVRIYRIPKFALKPIGNKVVNVGSTLTFTVSVPESIGGTFNYSVPGLPSSATFDSSTGNFSWTPTLDQVGSHSIVFSVADGERTASEEILVTVVDWPRALTATNGTSELINLAWLPPYDLTKVAGYRIYKNGVEIGSTSDPTFDVTSILPGSQSKFKIASCDWEGNIIGFSNEITLAFSSELGIYPGMRYHSSNSWTGTVYVFASDSTSWSLQSSDSSWINVTGSSTGNGKFEYEISKNNGTTKREGEISLICGGSQTITYNIVQHPKKAPTSVGFYDQGAKQFLLWDSLEGGTPETVKWDSVDDNWMPIVGDWNGNGTCTVGFYNLAEGRFFLDNDNSFAGNNSDRNIEYGPRTTGYIPIVGDWNGDGIHTVGLYYPATGAFFLTNNTGENNVSILPDLIFNFGPVGLYDAEKGVFYLKRSFVTVHDELVVAYGPVREGRIPVAGDWDGDQVDTIGLYDPETGKFYLRNSNSPGEADVTFDLVTPGSRWIPVSGEF